MVATITECLPFAKEAGMPRSFQAITGVSAALLAGLVGCASSHDRADQRAVSNDAICQGQKN